MLREPQPGPPTSSTASRPDKIPSGAEKLIQCLEREGVDYIFGLSGGAAIPIFDALVDTHIKLILVRHEQGATHMADG
jgi:acetolactate synthase-1/2/3 large subunit